MGGARGGSRGGRGASAGRGGARGGAEARAGGSARRGRARGHVTTREADGPREGRTFRGIPPAIAAVPSRRERAMTIIGRNEGLSNPPDRAEPPAMPNPSADQAQQCTRLARCCASTRRARELASATPRASHPARGRSPFGFPPSARRAPSPRSARRPRASPARVPRRIQARPSRPPPRHAVVRHERRARGRGVDEHRRGGRARRRRHEGARGERVHEAQGPAPVLGVLAVGPPAVLRGLGVARGGPAMLEMRQGQARREGRRVPQGPPRFRQAEQRQDGPRPQPPEEAGGERVQRREARRGPTDPEPRSLLRLKPRGGSRSNPRESLRLVRRRRAPRPPAGAPRETRGPAEAVRPGRGRARGAEEHAVPRGGVQAEQPLAVGAPRRRPVAPLPPIGPIRPTREHRRLRLRLRVRVAPQLREARVGVDVGVGVGAAVAGLPRGFLGSSSRSPLDERYERSRRLDALRGLRLEDEFERRVSGGYPSLHETTASLHETPRPSPRPRARTRGRREAPRRRFPRRARRGDGDASAFPAGGARARRSG